MSNKLYIGNIDKQVSEDEIRQLFLDRGIALQDVLLKSGYAFAECEDQAAVDNAIDKLAGKFHLVKWRFRIEAWT